MGMGVKTRFVFIKFRNFLSETSIEVFVVFLLDGLQKQGSWYNFLLFFFVALD